MRWDEMRQSTNIEDRRRGGSRVMVGGGIGSVVLLLLYLLFGGNPLALLQSDSGSAPSGGPAQTIPANDQQAHFVSAVLGDTEDVWRDLFRRMNREYREPHLVLFSGSTQSACGYGSAAVGPFYCPPDERVYIDLS